MSRDFIERLTLLILIVGGLLGLCIYLDNTNGSSACRHCGYVTHSFKANHGCKVPGCDQKTPH